jgi:acyl-CoA synthetase (AMP-forming)/AMP-acid ligase II
VSDQAAPADNYVLQALDLFDGYGEATAIVMGDSQLSYAAVANATRGLAAVLHEAGLGEDSAVAMLVSDRPESASLQLALHLLGCRTIWIATYAPRRQQLDYIGLAQADVLIYNAGTQQRAELVAELASQNPSLKIFALGGGTEHPDLLASIPEQARDLPAEQVGASPESLFYTGGTTGLPKLVHHWQGFYKTMLAIAAYYRSVGEPPMRFLSGSTFSLVSGQLPAFLTLFEGGTFFITVGFDEGEFLRAIEEHKISSAFLTPTLLYRVIEHPDAATTDTSSLRYLNVGGAAAFPARLGEAIDILGPVVRIVYGSSELPLITDLPFLDHDPEHPERLKSAGKPFADTRIEIRDAEGTVLKPGESGEVWVSGSLMMAGYWQQPEATRETVAGGWVRTGDAGYLDEDGYLYLVDRLRDMIVTKGVAANVYARPIEDALVSHPKVLEAAVIGVPHERWGEAVHAVVVTEPGAEVTAEELQEFVRGELNNLYTPETVEFVTELPLTPLTKVDKKQLRQRHVERAAAQAAPEA